MADDLKPIEQWTPKERLFVAKYFELNFNGTKAAIAAKYSEKTAPQIAYENLRKPHIKAEVERRFRELAMPQEEVLARLSEQARGDMGDFMGLAHEDVEAHPKSALIKKYKRTITIYVGKGEKEDREIEHLEIELYDAQAALSLIGRHHKLFTEKVEHTGKDGEQLIIAVTKMDVGEL